MFYLTYIKLVFYRFPNDKWWHFQAFHDTRKALTYLNVSQKKTVTKKSQEPGISGLNSRW